MMNANIIDINAKDSFALFRGVDLQCLIEQIESYFLEYRDTLNLPDNLTFGTEIEYEGVFKRFVDKYINDFTDWCSKEEEFIIGGEISSPIMIDSPQYWKELKIICNYLTKRRADTLHKAGGHIHVGANILEKDVEAWRIFLKLYMVYEHVLFRFAYGDKISARKKIVEHARPIAYELYNLLEVLNNIEDMNKLLLNIASIGKHTSLNMNNLLKDRNTLEFRLFNASTNEIIWQNNINTVSKMLLAAKNKFIDEGFLDYKLNNGFESFRDKMYRYNIVNLKDSLEFVDLVFDNNLDKVYFLRQYFKNFENNYGLNKAVMAKRFVKVA